MATVGVAGFTGKFARVLTSALLEYPEIKIKGYCRDISKLTHSIVSNSRIHVQQGDSFDVATIQSFVSGCDVVVCCYLGDDRLMIDGQKLLIDACAAKGVPRYVASDWAFDYTKLEYGQLPAKDPMKHIKAYLDAQEKVEGVHILVGGFMNPFFSPPFGIWDAPSTTFRYWGSGEEIWEGTTYENAAEYTAAVCADASAVGVLKLVGGRASFREITESFAKVYSMEPKLERLGSVEELYNHMHELRRTEPQNYLSYLFLFFQYYMVNGQTLLGPDLDNHRYPQVRAVDWEDFMKSTPVKQLAFSFSHVGQSG